MGGVAIQRDIHQCLVGGPLCLSHNKTAQWIFSECSTEIKLRLSNRWPFSEMFCARSVTVLDLVS